MPKLAEIERQIAENPNNYIFWTKKEVRALQNILEADEPVKAATSGFMNGVTWLAVCTDRRIIFINCGWLFGMRQLQVPLDRVQAIDNEATIFFGSITVWDGASAFTISMVLKSSIMPFVKVAQEQISIYKKQHSMQAKASAPMDIASQLERLADLKERGHLTEEEFEAQKKKLLA